MKVSGLYNNIIRFKENNKIKINRNCFYTEVGFLTIVSGIIKKITSNFTKLCSNALPIIQNLLSGTMTEIDD